MRVLKPGRWLTVEFHNSDSKVWNAIQEAISSSGFVVADVTTLDKKQKTIHQDFNVNGTVNKDLVISAYKPRFDYSDGSFLEFELDSFCDEYLKSIRVYEMADSSLAPVVERTARGIFNRIVSFCVSKCVSVPISLAECYQYLLKRYALRDEMFFLFDQVAIYDEKKVVYKEVMQLEISVSDEASSIEWLRVKLKKTPYKFQEIQPLYLQELTQWSRNEFQIDLATILEENFLHYDGSYEIPSQIHSYLSTNHKDLRNLPKDDPKLIAKAKDRWYVPDPNKAADLEKLRERSLLKEFETYKTTSKKIKQPRGEALRAGFKKAWETGDYALIQEIAKKIPADVLQEDEKLLMYYDNASSMSGDDDFDW